jgi:PEP-CTERM motif
MKNPIAAVVTSLAGLALAAAAHAAPTAPTASLSKTFTEYTGAGPIGNNGVQDQDNFYWMYESSGNYLGQDVHSWWLMWDPKNSASVRGTVSFASSILYMHDDKAELIATNGFQKAGVAYTYAANAVGLEAGDKSNTSFAGDTLTLRWGASSPGDHIRVMTAVPEPATYALLFLGLVAIGLFATRRSNRDEDR